MMKHIHAIGLGSLAVIAVGVAALLVTAGSASSSSAAKSVSATPPVPDQVSPAGKWATDSIWYDGLVEKAVYDAEKVIYGHPRHYEAVILTNKEQHDPATWTKDADGQGPTVEVWKHNKIEVIPTPNYDYKFETTSHFAVNNLALTRLDVASQEWCGASFKQYIRKDGDGLAWDYFGWSYLPEQGRRTGTVQQGEKPVVPFNGLSLYLRGYDFQSRQPLDIQLLPDQKSNSLEPYEPVDATVTFAGETDDSYKLDVQADGKLIGTFTFAKDRRHVMLAYEGVNGDKYTLKHLDRVDYWTRHEE